MARWEQVEQVFHEAVALPEGTNRIEWLAKRCAGDSELLGEVSSLLQAGSRMSEWREEAPEVPPLPPGPFGVYRPVRLLGRGGMSAVYLAERIDGQFEQTVALKVMAAYLAGSDFLQRFQTEGNVLASLHHPHITKLLDGGVSPAGEPYLILEYVEGEPLDRYCDHHHLAIDARLRIFAQICEAVDFAHRNLILHRDLKPGNILVASDGAPRLLDFGTASLMRADAAVTVSQTRMLTPRYASPEQLRGERPGVTGDVFSLGVILYELLTGAWPFGTSSSMLSDLRRAAGDAVVTLPSSAITAEAAAGRSISVKKLRTLLAGDLSAIVMKALEHEPARRYATARELMEDVERYLAGRPVHARPQTLGYRAAKFLRRRWLPVSATAVFILGLGAATGIAIYQARAARSEQHKAEQVSDFLTDVLTATSQAHFNPETYTVAQLLDSAEHRLAEGPRQDPQVQALEHLSLAKSYTRMHLSAKAIAQFDAAIPKLQAAGDQADLVEALEVESYALADQGHHDAAVQNLERSLSLLAKMGKDAPPRTGFRCQGGPGIHAFVPHAYPVGPGAPIVPRSDRFGPPRSQHSQSGSGEGTYRLCQRLGRRW